jgi:DNA-binding MarR family transcriptional regulator
VTAHADGVDTEDDVAELVGLLLDDLGPAMQWYRDEVGRLLGLAPAEVVCLEVVRRHGVALGSQVRERTGMTRSANAKMLRRLEEAGHLERTPGRDGDVEVEIVLLPHAERDALLAALRRELTRGIGFLVDARGVDVVAGLGQALHVRARGMADAADERRRLAVRRRKREADPITPWWTR